MFLVLVRHAAVAQVPDQPSPLWWLSDEGRAAARALARDPLWRDVSRIFCSPELKAHETAQIIASPNGISVTVVEDLHEVERPPGQWFGDDYPGGYAGAVAEYFAHPTKATHGWETPAAAGARMQSCIDRLIESLTEPAAMVGHGLTLTLYLHRLLGLEPWSVWPAIRFPDVAVVDPAGRRLLHPFGSPPQ